jgi:predicted nucleic acid-binding protein
MTSDRLFLDTAYVQALINAHDQYHDAARALFPRVRLATEVWVTEAVLIEVGNVLARSHRSAAAAFISGCYTTPNVRVVSVDTPLLHRANDLYRQRADKTWGLTDCLSFVVMWERGLTDALTTDEHFRQAGFQVLLRDTIRD